MSFSITTAFVQQYKGNVFHLAQQQDSRLRNTVMSDMIIGESGFLEQLAPTVAVKRVARHGDSPVMNATHLRRRVTPYDFEWGDLVDTLDKVRTLIDPENEYVKAAGYAMGRAFDGEIMGAFFGPAYSGKDGSTVLTWPTGPTGGNNGTIVPVNDWTYGTGTGNSGLTISKLISAKVALDVAEAPAEDRYIGLGGIQLGNLLATTEATSADYNTVKALVQGQIDTFMGFKFVHTELLQKNASGQWRVPAWQKSGMGLGLAQDDKSNVAQRPDKSFAWYVYANAAFGATRMEEAKVVEIVCV